MQLLKSIALVALTSATIGSFAFADSFASLELSQILEQAHMQKAQGKNPVVLFDLGDTLVSFP